MKESKYVRLAYIIYRVLRNSRIPLFLHRKSNQYSWSILDETTVIQDKTGAIAIEINPVDSAGSATKKRGIVVRFASELDEFNRILANQKLVELARKVDQVNPKQKEATAISRFDIFEI